MPHSTTIQPEMNYKLRMWSRVKPWSINPTAETKANTKISAIASLFLCLFGNYPAILNHGVLIA